MTVIKKSQASAWKIKYPEILKTHIGICLRKYTFPFPHLWPKSALRRETFVPKSERSILKNLCIYYKKYTNEKKVCYSQTVLLLHGNIWIQNSGNIKCFPRLFTVSLSFQVPWVRRKCLTSTFFPEWLFSCAYVSCDAKKTVSALSGVNQGHF